MRAGDGQKPLSLPKREGWLLLSRLAPHRPMEKKGGGAGQGGRQSGQAGKGHGGWRAALARPALPQPPTKRVEKGRARPAVRAIWCAAAPPPLPFKAARCAMPGGCVCGFGAGGLMEEESPCTED
jgi:hypothetical protein